MNDIITYADVARFYADKDDTDEIATGAYENVAFWIWKMTHEGVQQSVFLYCPSPKNERMVDKMPDDKEFALYVATRFDMKWQTVSIYDKYKKEQTPLFNIWFEERCKPNQDNKFQPGQKWHLFEYILYRELNSMYKFSKKAGEVVDLEKAPFNYYNNSKNIDLMVWMAKNAGFNEEIEKAMKAANAGEKKLTCACIREYVSWKKISETINEWKHNHPI